MIFKGTQHDQSFCDQYFPASLVVLSHHVRFRDFCIFVRHSYTTQSIRAEALIGCSEKERVETEDRALNRAYNHFRAIEFKIADSIEGSAEQ